MAGGPSPLGGADDRLAVAAAALVLRRYTGVPVRTLARPGGAVTVDLTADVPGRDLPSLLRPAAPGAEPSAELDAAARVVGAADCPPEALPALHEDLEALLAELGADPGRSSADLLVRSAYERTGPVVADPDPDAVARAAAIAAQPSVAAAFAAVVATHPEAPAVLAEDGSLTFRRLGGLVAATASGLSPGGSAALLCTHGPATVTALLAALAAGKAYVPLDPTYPRARLVEILLDSGADVLLVDEDHAAAAADLLAAAGSAVPVVRVATSGDGVPPAGPAGPDDPAYLLYTSGSTGRPKGVVQTHGGVLAGIANHVRNLGITPADRTGVVSSFGFDMAVTDLFGGLLAGAAAVPVDLRTAGLEHLAETLERHRVSVYHSTPTVYRYLVAALRGGRLPHIRTVLLGGEEVTAHDVTLARRHFAPDVVFVNGYGTTEVSFVAQHHLRPADEVVGAVVPVGYPMSGVDVVLLDPAGRPCALTGEVLARGSLVARGYWRRPELTAERFAPYRGERAYRTGDLARRLPDGRLTFLGRTDRQVKVRGFRVELGEVESSLAAVDGVARAAVVARRTAAGDTEIVGYVVPTGELDPAAALRTLATRLPDHMVPRTLVPVTALPMGPTGKLDVAALPAPAAAGAPVGGSDDETTAAVRRIWGEVLGLAEVPDDVGFRELGGHSLQLALVQQRLRSDVGVTVSLARLHEHATVGALAAHLRGDGPDHRPVVRRAADRMRRRREGRR